jgi:hypothetical protein
LQFHAERGGAHRREYQQPQQLLKRANATLHDRNAAVLTWREIRLFVPRRLPLNRPKGWNGGRKDGSIRRCPTDPLKFGRPSTEGSGGGACRCSWPAAIALRSLLLK